jgi:hypothetical protein
MADPFIFYSRDEEGRFETHATEAAARRDAEEILDNCQEQASDSGWPEGIGDIEWGRLVPLGECVASNKRESDRSDFDYLVDYNLKDLADPTAIADEKRDESRDAWLIWNRGVITVSYAFDPVEAGIRSSERYVPASELEAERAVHEETKRRLEAERAEANDKIAQISSVCHRIASENHALSLRLDAETAARKEAERKLDALTRWRKQSEEPCPIVDAYLQRRVIGELRVEKSDPRALNSDHEYRHTPESLDAMEKAKSE